MYLYTLGMNRIVYKAQNFATGKNVTVKLRKPNLVELQPKTLTEIGDGLYYIDHNFSEYGAYIGLFYEDGIPTTMETIRLESNALLELLQTAIEDGAVNTRLVV